MLTLTAALLATAATAQQTPVGERQGEISQAPFSPTAGARTFNIPAQPLETAVTAFGRQAGVQVSIETSVARGIQTGGVTGTMTPSQALSQLLAGTGIVGRVVSDREVILTKAQASGLPPGVMQLDPVQVQGYPVPSQAMIDNLPPPYAGGQVATGGQLGLLGNRPVMDTPFNQTSYTAKKAQDQQARAIRDVLIDDPSIRSTRADNSLGPDQWMIRGFPVGSIGYSYGGLYGMLPELSPVVQLAERVEVLKGPSAMLNGMPPGGFVGGTVNVIPKRAPDEPLTQATASYISAGQVGGHIDFARRFGPEKEVGVRINGVFRAGKTEQQYNSDQIGFAVLGLDFRGERVRLAADLGYQYQYMGGVTPYLGLAAGVPLPWAPNVRNNPTAQPWGYNERKDLFGVARAEVDLAESVTAYAAVGGHDSRFASLYSGRTTITSFNGNGTAQAPENQSYYASYFTAEAGIRAIVHTGPIDHDLAFTATTYASEQGSGVVSGTSFATNIYNPVIIARPSIPTPAANKISTNGLSSLAIADTLSAAEKRIQLTVGARLQQVTAANFNATTGAQTSSYSQSALSPSVALVVKPYWNNVSFYANWIQGLQQGVIVPQQFANAGETFPPFKSTQYEVGFKVDWGRLTTTASVFQISQPSILTNVATNTQFLGGEQVNQGLELNFFGEPIEGFRILGGAMLVSPVLTKTQGGLTDGWIAPMVSQVNLNLASEWDVPFVPGLTLTGRAIYTGSQYIDTTWPRRSLPEWTRFDLGVRYAFENPGAKGKLLVARFNVDNVLDANYWPGGSNAAQLYLAAPRTFRLSLTADF